jgi:hypothetical protein
VTSTFLRPRDGLSGPRLLVVDGYTDLDPGGRPGLEGHASVEFEHGGLVGDEKRDRRRPGEVEGTLVAERGAELAAFAQASTGLAGSVRATARPPAGRPVAIRAGAPIWRASTGASFASGTVPAGHRRAGDRPRRR